MDTDRDEEDLPPVVPATVIAVAAVVVCLCVFVVLPWLADLVFP